MRGRRGYSSSKPVTELAPPPRGPGAGVRTRDVTRADKAKAVTAALANNRLRITPGQARAITEVIHHRPKERPMTLTTIVALIVLVVAVLVAVGFVPASAPVVGLLIAALAAALLVGRL